MHIDKWAFSILSVSVRLAFKRSPRAGRWNEV